MTSFNDALQHFITGIIDKRTACSAVHRNLSNCRSSAGTLVTVLVEISV